MAIAKSYNLLEQDEYINPNAVVVSEVESDVCDWNFKMYQEEDCDGSSGSSLVLYFDGYMNPIDYETDDDEEENGFGQKELIRRTIRRFASFNLVCDQLRNEYLHRFSALKNMVLEVRDGGEIYTLKRIDIDRQGILDGYLVDNVVKLYFMHEDFDELGMMSCCRPAYTDAPFTDDCPDVTGSTGECGTFSLLITIEDTTLTATPTDAPGAVTINWVYRETSADPWTLLIQDASSVSLGAYGQYKAIATSEGCSADDTYLFQDPCAQVTVTIQDNGTGLVAVGSGCDTPTYTWSEWNVGTEAWDEVFTGASYVPSGAGIFKVVMTGCDACAPEAIHEWEGETGCEIDTDLQYVAGVLGVLHDACAEGETASYEFYRDQGSGPVLVQSGLDATYDVTEEGLYEVYLTCTDGCTGYARLVILQSETCVLTLSVGVTDDTATATLDGCGEDPATYTWFRNIGSGFNQVGTGNPFELPGTGLYRLTVECGECSKTIDFFHCPDGDGEDTCKQSQYFEGFSGTDLTITEFTLPDTGTYAEEWLRDHVWVFRASGKVSYNIGFTIDNGTNKIILSWEAEGEYIEVYFFAECV